MRAAVIGVGSMGRNHARVYHELDEVDLVAVADVDRKQAEYVAASYGTKAYDNYKRMLDEAKPDLVSIVVPTSRHFKTARHVMKRGVHALVEKPIAASVDEALEMIRLSNQHKVVLTVGHIERFNPAIIELKRRLDAGELGRIFEIHARRLGPFPPRIQDVGVIVDLATHDLDVIHTLVDAPVERVYAETDRRIHVAHEDMVMGLIKFGNGTLGIIDINWLTPTKIRELIVTGERGMFVASYLTQELRYYQNMHMKTCEPADEVSGVTEGDMIKYSIQRREPLKEELRAFVRSVENGEPPAISPWDGLEALRLASTLIESSEKQQPIWLGKDAEAHKANGRNLTRPWSHGESKPTAMIGLD